MRVIPDTDPQGVPVSWTTAIGKLPIAGPVMVGREGLAGDEQADRIHHGGPDKAVLCYPRAHYANWSAELGAGAIQEGTLGENLELGDATEADVCVGDRLQCGNVIFEISQPRQPCWKPARFHSRPDLTALILKTGRTGWYVRVAQSGAIEAPAELQLIERPNPDWTVARATYVMHFEKGIPLRRELMALPALSAEWKRELAGRISA